MVNLPTPKYMVETYSHDVELSVVSVDSPRFLLLIILRFGI